MDMRRRTSGLALQVQQGLKRDFYPRVSRPPDQGALARRCGYVALCQAARSRALIWPAATDGVVAITASQRDRLVEAIAGGKSSRLRICLKMD